MEFDDPDRHRESEEHVKALERRLAAWRPASGALDRDRMLYDAGRSAATGDSHAQIWRGATAALLLLATGLGGLLVRQSSVLSRERSLLAHERAQRSRIQNAATAIASGIPSEASHPRSDSAPVERFAPASYFVLTSRLAASEASTLRPEGEGANGSNRRDRRRSEQAPAPAPLRPRDVQRVFQL
jgi:hypothetical protein